MSYGYQGVDIFMVPRSSTPTPSQYMTSNFEPETYGRIFVQLKSQITILSSILKALNEATDLIPEEVQPMNNLRNAVKNLMGCTYGTLFQTNAEVLAHIRVLTKDPVTPRIMKLGYRVMHVCLALNNIKSVLTLTPFQDRNSGSDEESMSGSCSPIISGSFISFPVDEEDLSTIVCRICDEPVPLQLIEAHSKVCMEAYRFSEKMRSTNDRIWRLIIQTEQGLLNKPIPGDENTSLTWTLPIIHIIVILEMIANIDENAESSNEEMHFLRNLLTKITIEGETKDAASHLQSNAIQLVDSKMKAANELHDALDDVQEIGNGRANKIIQDTIISDFIFIKRISSGAYSHVFLARKKKTGDIYAIKAIPKNRTIQKNEMHRVITERDILAQINSPFMIRFFYSIIGDNNLYIVMEYTPGGDLASVLSVVGCFGEEHAKIYTAQVVAALEFLRANNIIHRDLKPSNILVSADGHLKLTDFGLSYYGMVDRSLESDDKEKQVAVGTPDYMAPEVIWQRPHSFTADYWSLGCIIYEFLVGIPPFHGKTPQKTFTNIVRAKYDKNEIVRFSDEVKDLIDKLLCVDPQNRLGSSSIAEIKSHPWFAGIDWAHLDQLTPPFVPSGDPESTDFFEENEQYPFTEEDEKNIREDIKYSSRMDRRRSSMSLRTDDSWMTDTLDDEIAKFPSISVGSLKDITMEEYAKRIRNMKNNRTMSFSGDQSDENVTNYRFPESRSFSRLSDFQETQDPVHVHINHRRRASKPRFVMSNSTKLYPSVAVNSVDYTESDVSSGF